MHGINGRKPGTTTRRTSAGEPPSRPRAAKPRTRRSYETITVSHATAPLDGSSGGQFAQGMPLFAREVMGEARDAGLAGTLLLQGKLKANKSRGRPPLVLLCEKKRKTLPDYRLPARLYGLGGV